MRDVDVTEPDDGGPGRPAGRGAIESVGAPGVDAATRRLDPTG